MAGKDRRFGVRMIWQHRQYLFRRDGEKGRAITIDPRQTCKFGSVAQLNYSRPPSLLRHLTWGLTNLLSKVDIEQ